MAEFDTGLPPEVDISDKNISSIIYNKSDIESLSKIKIVAYQKSDIEKIDKTEIKNIIIRKTDSETI